MQNKLFSVNKTLNLNGKIVDLSEPKIMGILNITPDSFYSGSRFRDEKSILQHVEKMLFEGATFIDVGGYSSRPGAADVTLEEELSRITAPIQSIAKHFPEAYISIDTFRATVAKAAVETGASMVNDISGGQLDQDMLHTVAKLQVPYICMHMQGTPQNMMQHIAYNDLLKEVVDYFHYRIHQIHQAGIKDVVVDPGFGFSKTADQSFQLLKNLAHFQILGKPLLVGLSRKSMIWRTLNIDAEKALNGTTTLNTVALLKGASILRVHDVKESAEAIKLIKFVQ